MMHVDTAMIIDRIITDARIRLSVVSALPISHLYHSHQPCALRLCES